MTNKQILAKELKKDEMKIGIFDPKMESIIKKWINVIKDDMTYGSTDIEIRINRKVHIVEVSHVDNEVDFIITTPTAYESKYGRKFGED